MLAASLLLAPLAAPQTEGLFNCTIGPDPSDPNPGNPTLPFKISMTTFTPTLPYKSSYCEFSGLDNLTAVQGSEDDPVHHPGCEACYRSSDFSYTCHCKCPSTQTTPCTWDWHGTATFFPSYGRGASCACNGETPMPPPPPKPPPPPPPTPPAPPPPCKAKLDVVVVLDGSASIVSSDWQKALSFTNKLVGGFNVSSDQVEVAVVQFSSTSQTVIDLSADAVAIESAVSTLRQMRENTNTHAGFTTAKTILDTHGRPNTAGRLVILLTDGQQNQGQPAKLVSDALKAENVTIFGIGVGSMIDTREIESWVSTPLSSHYFKVSAWAALEKILNALIQAACPPHPPPAAPKA